MQFGRHGVRAKKVDEKFTVVCSCSPQDVEFGHFTLFCRDKEMYKNLKCTCRPIVYPH